MGIVGRDDIDLRQLADTAKPAFVAVVVGRWHDGSRVARFPADLREEKNAFDHGVFGRAGIARQRGPATAQTADKYPDKPIRIMAPYAPGGNIDVTARIIAEKLKDVLGVTVLVENKAGASGMIGSDIIARSVARRLQPAGLGQLAGRRARDLRQRALRLAHGLPADQPHPGRARRADRAARSRRSRRWPTSLRSGKDGKFTVADLGRRHDQPHRHRAHRRGDRHQVHAGPLQGQRTGPSRPDRGPGAGAGRPGQCRDRPYQGGQDARHRRVVRQARAAAARRADHEGIGRRRAWRTSPSAPTRACSRRPSCRRRSWPSSTPPW